MSVASSYAENSSCSLTSSGTGSWLGLSYHAVCVSPVKCRSCSSGIVGVQRWCTEQRSCAPATGFVAARKQDAGATAVAGVVRRLRCCSLDQPVLDQNYALLLTFCSAALLTVPRLSYLLSLMEGDPSIALYTCFRAWPADLVLCVGMFGVCHRQGLPIASLLHCYLKSSYCSCPAAMQAGCSCSCTASVAVCSMFDLCFAPWSLQA